MRGFATVALAAAALIMALPATASAEVRSSLSVVTYDVRGHDLAAVWQDIERVAPRTLRIGHAQAETRIRYRWRVQYALNGGVCSAVRPVVDVAVTIVLPSWLDRERAPAAMQAAWQRYIAETRRHEDVHRAVAMEMAGKLDAALQGLPRQGSCSAVARLVDQSAERILAEERRRQTRLDQVAPPLRLPDMAPAIASGRAVSPQRASAR